MPPIETFTSGDDWASACAERIADALAAVVAQTGQATFAGSGGSTPSPIYARLGRADLDWSRVAATLVDERYVPEDHPESNAALLRRDLLVGPAAAARLIPLYSPQVTVDRAAAVATHALSAAPPLACALLGMGEDGHICSMFPESPTLKTLLTPSLPPVVLGVPPGRDGLAPSRERLSMNLPFLMSARSVVLALTGAAKRAVFEEQARGDPATTPIAALIASGAPLQVLWTERAA